MLTLLLWVIAALASALLALALTPVHFRLRAESAPHPRIRFGAAPLGGLVPAIPIYDSARGKPKKEKKADHPRKPRKAKRRARPGGPGARAALEVPRLIAGLLGQIRFDHLHVDADYGLGDPADTGVLCGLLAPFAYGLPARPGISVALRPDFQAARLAGEIGLGARITPAALLPPALRFAWSVWGPGR